MTGRRRLSLRKHFRKPMADDAGDLGHEIRHFSPLVRQQVLFKLGMNCPLGVYPSLFSTDKDAE